MDELVPETRAFLREHESRLREYRIVAFDLCRLVGLARTAHRAGYVDEPTAWRFILPAALKLQTTYPSWRALADDFLLGNRYIAEGHQSDPSVEGNVEWLKQSPSSPWQMLQWRNVPHE